MPTTEASPRARTQSTTGDDTGPPSSQDGREPSSTAPGPGSPVVPAVLPQQPTGPDPAPSPEASVAIINGLGPQARERLALAVAEHGRGFAIDADNTRVGPIRPVGDLVAAGVPFVITVGRSWLAMDLDLTGDAHDADRCQAMRQLEDALQGAGIPLVVMRSGRAGHLHALARVGRHADGHARDVITRWARSAGLDVRRDIRPPGSPHRLGYATGPRDGTWDDVDAILHAAEPPASALLDACRALDLGVLSARMRRCLREGHQTAGYPSPSEGRMALATAVVAIGLDRAYLKELLTDKANALGATFRARTEREQDRELDRLIEKATARVALPRPAAIGNRDDALVAVRRWVATVNRSPWPGRSAGSRIAVLRGLGNLAHACDGPVFSAALSTIAIAGGVSQDTARRVLAYALEERWLELVQESTATTAREYRLRIPQHMTQTADDLSRRDLDEVRIIRVNPSTGEPAVDADPVTDPGADLGRYRGLGKTGQRVLAACTAQPRTAAEIAADAGASVGSTRNQLRRLMTLDLVVRAARGSYVLGDADPGAVADGLPAAGARERDLTAQLEERAQRERDRAAWADARLLALEAFATGDVDLLEKATALLGPDDMQRIRQQHLRGERRAGDPT